MYTISYWWLLSFPSMFFPFCLLCLSRLFSILVPIHPNISSKQSICQDGLSKQICYLLPFQHPLVSCRSNVSSPSHHTLSGNIFSPCRCASWAVNARTPRNLRWKNVHRSRRILTRDARRRPLISAKVIPRVPNMVCIISEIKKVGWLYRNCHTLKNAISMTAIFQGFSVTMATVQLHRFPNFLIELLYVYF